MKTIAIQPSYRIPWSIETEHCHHGIPLSNGVFGALIWFDRDTIRITVNRADYWDRRGGLVWDENCTYANLRELLEAGLYEEAQGLFRIAHVHGREKKPTRLPLGRLELKLRAGVRIAAARLDLEAAEAAIDCEWGDRLLTLRFTILIDRPVLVGSVSRELVETVVALPAYEFPEARDYFDSFGIPPHRSMEEEGASGWTQELPEDPACAVRVSTAERFIVSCELAADGEAAAIAAKRQASELAEADYGPATALTKEAWRNLWARTADVACGDAGMETMYYLGIYRMLGNAMPGGIAPTLQGPWVEEHRMPPWSGDYHFNINVQMCVWPAYASNHLASLLPLFRMIDDWKPRLAEQARRFTGEEEGYQLVHACDDRGHPIGKFWTGIIDHANTSWVAQLMWQYGVYARDDAFLRQDVYPFMKGALRVFRKMMEEDGEVLSLPVTVSPEYGGAGAEAWGRNSTFFLTHVHFLCDKMLQLSERYGMDEAYAETVRGIRARLPRYASGPGRYGEELYLWEGQQLERSHRHHSHLAGVYPFETLDPHSEEHAELVARTYQAWIAAGMGEWTGWSMPWASILHGRMGSKDAAYYCLKLLRDVFLMPGYASRHNASFPGFTVFAGGDVMQAEASIGATAAVLELFVQCVNGVISVFPSVPDSIPHASFAGIRTEGALLLSAERREGRLVRLDLYSEKEGPIRLVNPVRGGVAIERRDGTSYSDAPLLLLHAAAGELVRIYPIDADPGKEEPSK